MRQRHAERPIPPVAMPAWPGQRHVHLIESGLRGLGSASRSAVLRAMARALDAHLAGVTDRHAARERVDAALDDLLKELGAVLGPTVRGGGLLPALPQALAGTRRRGSGARR